MTTGSSEQSVVVVTGAASGIGAAVATAFATRGWTVYATDIDSSFSPSVAADCRCLELDVTDVEACQRVVDRILEETREIDVLVNNAGFAVPGPVEDVSVESSRRQFDVLVHGTHAMTQAVLPSMRDRDRGRIVMLSSVLGVANSPGIGLYGAAKAAVESLSDSLRMELRRTGVSVTLVEPAWVDTDFSATAADHLPVDGRTATYNGIYKAITDGWIVEGGPLAVCPEDVASTVIEAATAPRVARRYPVGPVSRLVMASRFVPTRLRDGITTTLLRWSVPARRWWEFFAGGNSATASESTVRLSTGHELSVPLSTHASVSGVVVSAATAGVDALLPDSLTPVRLTPSRAALTIASVDYDRIGRGEIDPYNEVALIIPAVSADTTRLPVVSGLSSTLGGYVWQLPVTTDPACALGREIWGYPKSLAEISIETDSGRTRTELTVGDQRVLSLAVDQPSTRRRDVSLSSYTAVDDGFCQIDHTLAGNLGVRPLSDRFRLSLGDHPWAKTLAGVDLGSRAVVRFSGDCEFTIGNPKAVGRDETSNTADRHL